MEIVSYPNASCEVENSPISIEFLRNQGFAHVDEEWWQFQDQHCRLLNSVDGKLLLEFPLVRGSRLSFVACRLEEDIKKIVRILH